LDVIDKMERSFKMRQVSPWMLVSRGFARTTSLIVFLYASFFSIHLNGQRTRIHAVSDLGHQFSFYADGRFHTQYLPGQPKAVCWGALYNYDFSNVNLLILLGCEEQLSYTSKDIDVIKQFLFQGGGVLILSSALSVEQSKLAEVFGVHFKSKAMKPFQGVVKQISSRIEGEADWMHFDDPSQWQELIKDANLRPILARRKVGLGNLLIGARGLAGRNPNAQDKINAAWWKPLLLLTAADKKIDSQKSFGRLGFPEMEYIENLDGIKLCYHEYLKPYAEAMAKIYQRTKPIIHKRMGVPLYPGMAGTIGLLATGGGGFSSGSTLGLGVFWGGFPGREDSMIELITHETVHSWVLPFNEIWNEPIATYVGNLVMMDMGYEQEGLRRIDRQISRGLRLDSTMKLYDQNGRTFDGNIPDLEGVDAKDMLWGKTFWLFEQLRKENPDVIADYFRAKRKLALPSELKYYDVNATVAVISVAMGRDMFTWFRDHGFDVNKLDSKIKVDL